MKKGDTPASKKNLGGRPKKKINQKQFEALCVIQCTEEEILAVLDITDKTLTTWCKETYGKSFSEIFREKRLGGKASLRRQQWALASKNATMAIWLGKQYLGQTDKVDNQVDIQGIEIVADIPSKENE